MVKILSIHDEGFFPKLTFDAPLHTLSKLYEVPVDLTPPPSFEAVYCYSCRRISDNKVKDVILNLIGQIKHIDASKPDI